MPCRRRVAHPPRRCQPHTHTHTHCHGARARPNTHTGQCVVYVCQCCVCGSMSKACAPARLPRARRSAVAERKRPRCATGTGCSCGRCAFHAWTTSAPRASAGRARRASTKPSRRPQAQKRASTARHTLGRRWAPTRCSPASVRQATLALMAGPVKGVRRDGTSPQRAARLAAPARRVRTARAGHRRAWRVRQASMKAPARRPRAAACVPQIEPLCRAALPFLTASVTSATPATARARTAHKGSTRIP